MESIGQASKQGGVKGGLTLLLWSVDFFMAREGAE